MAGVDWLMIGLWYWCTDQYIVQRTLGAPNEREARRGTIFVACLKLLPVFIFIIPGMIALALARTGRVPALRVLVDPSSAVVPAAAQAAFPLMVQSVMPPGLRAIVVAGLLAALMSSLAGAFNAASTLFTIDFYSKLRPFLVSVVVLIAVSHATRPPKTEQLTGLTYATVTPEQRRATRRSWNHWDVVSSAIVLALIAAAYTYFNG